MKLTVILVAVTLLHVSASSVAQNLTLKTKNANLKEVFNEIKKQTGLNILYRTSDMRNTQPVTLNINSKSIQEVMEIILQNQKLDFGINDKNIVIKPKEEKSFVEKLIDRLQAIDISGRVVDNEGNPLSGATVTIKGTKISTFTKDDGSFTVSGVSEDAIIVIKYLGYKDQELQAGASFKTVKLTATTNVLNDVSITVNTGYQVLSKERSAGSFSKPDMKLVTERATSMNILQRLDGLVPGLTINNSPGATTYQIRGLSTINANREPLFIVDGVQLEGSNIANINPQDVADVSVLKDATASSIWGARAANGVIVITTKKGKPSDKVTVQYNSFLSFKGKPQLDYYPSANSKEFIQTIKEIYTDSLNIIFPWANVTGNPTLSSVGIPPHELILYNKYRGLITAEEANNSLDSLSNISNSQQIRDLWYRNSMQSNQTISLSGGSNVYSFYASAAYTNTVASTIGNKNNSYKINVRQDFKLGKRINMFLITDVTNNVTSSKRPISPDSRFLPYQLFKDANGNNININYKTPFIDATKTIYEQRSKINLDYSPFDEYNYGDTKTQFYSGRINFGATVKLFNGLRYEGTYGYYKGINRSEIYDDAKSYPVRIELLQFTVSPTTTSTPAYSLPTQGGTFSVTGFNQTNWTVRNQFVYDKEWTDKKNQLTLLLGQEAQNQTSINNSSTLRGYNRSLQTYGNVDYASLGSGVGLLSPVFPNRNGFSLLSNNSFNQSEAAEIRLSSYYANGAYTYDQKYVLNTSWRIDNSNLFGFDKSAQNRPVWSIGGKWIASEEKNLQNLTWLNLFALRATYGITGNSPVPGQAASFDILAPQTSAFLPNNLGLLINTPGNDKLLWERTKNLNTGIDFGFFQGRLNGSVDYYYKNTSDLISAVNVNPLTGYATITGNLGDIRNQGIELNINSVNIQLANFAWRTSLNLSFNKNKLTNDARTTAITTGDQLTSVQYLTNYPAFTIFSYNYAGLDNLGDPTIRLADGSVSKMKSVAKVNDMIFSGTSQPVWNGGLSNTFMYKNFSLSANAVFSLGHVMRKNTYPAYAYPLTYTGRFTSGSIIDMGSWSGFQGGNISRDFLSRWKTPGDELITNIPSYSLNGANAANRRDIDYYNFATINVFDASFIKFRDVTLNYSLPFTLVKAINVKAVSLRAQVSNIMLWKANHNGIDPEFGTTSVPVYQNMITVGANVTF